MNAHDLAEGILAIEERIFLTSQEHKLFQNSANMLRQQADRIVELEKNAEPVAWMFQGAFDISTYVSFEKPNPDIYPNPKPLYTAPQTKPLSEEKISQIYKKVYEEGHDNQVVALCRAIEKEHGIK